ncbi:MAG: C25 family cysteine peptidase [Candidatus Thorarchaeota archaeon]
MFVRKMIFVPVLLCLLLAPLSLTGLSNHSVTYYADDEAVDQRTLADDNIVSVPLSKATFVASDPTSYKDEFSYFAAIPTTVFAHSGTQYLSPLIFASGSQSETWLIEDWVEYLSEDEGITSAVTIGDIPYSLTTEIHNTLESRLWPQITGDDSAEIAALLAAQDWQTSDFAVISLAKDSFSDSSIITGSGEHTFNEVSVTIAEPTASINNDNPIQITFTPPTSAGWVEGFVNWTGTELFTHTMGTPTEPAVDYSVIDQVYFERNPGYVLSPVPLHFWYPKTSDGTWTIEVTPESSISRTIPFDCEIKYHPGIEQSVTVPLDAKWLNVSIIWDNIGTDLNIALVDPNGGLVQWAPAGSILSGPGGDSVNVPYPQAGEWKVVVAWMNAITEQNNVDVNWEIERLPQNLAGYLESAANGAVLASLLNIPLLYVTDTSVPAITEWALNRLGVTNVILVDPADIHLGTLETQLGLLASLTNVATYGMITDLIWTAQQANFGSTQNDIVITTPMGSGSEVFAPAAYTAAKQGAPVFSLCGDGNLVTTRAEETWAPYLIGPEIDAYYITSRWTTRTENGWYDERIPNRYSMHESATQFKNFLDLRSAFDANGSQSVTIISSTDLIKTSFDRSLQGHFQVGRIPTNDPALASVFINRGALHRFLFLSAESADTALLSMYAYTDDYPYRDNYGSIHTISQYDNSLDMLQTGGFVVESHVGQNEVFENIASQPAFWSFSTHGTLTLLPTDPPERPGGQGMFSLRDIDADYGFEESLTTRDVNGDGLVNPVLYSSEIGHHVFTTADNLEARIDNIGSPIVIITACLLGGSMLPIMLMEHGAVGVVAAPRTVYFQPGGFLCTLATAALSEGNTTGAAVADALVMMSANYLSQTTGYQDYGNQQVLFGDPGVRLYNPVSDPHIPAMNPLTVSFGNHEPGRGVPSVASIGSTNYLPQTLANLGIETDFYTSSNFTDLEILLELRSIVLVSPDSFPTLASAFDGAAAGLEEYVENGGTLMVFGVSGDTSWLPWSVTYDDTSTGSLIEIEESEHPLVTDSNTISTNLDYQGSFTSVWENFTIIATDGTNPVLLASVYGTGKIALSTIVPSGATGDNLVENAANWFTSPSIILAEVSLSQEIIWEGDRLVITIRLTNSSGAGMTGLSPTVFLNTTEVDAVDGGNGIYTITLTESWTNARPGPYELRVLASRTGYDTLTSVVKDLFYIRSSPLLLLLIGGGIIVAIVGLWGLSKRRSGEKIVGRDVKTKTPKERKRQRQKDGKFDAKEYFDV